MKAIPTATAVMALMLAAPAVAQDATVLAAAEAAKESYLETLESLVNTDSGTGYVEGLSRIEAVLIERLAARGFAIETTPSEEFGGNTIIASKDGTGDKSILLMVHYDTVFGEGTAAERPFAIADGRATGPGVGDAKSGVAVILHTVDLLDELGFDGYGTLTVLLNPDEEKGSAGSRDVIRETAATQDYVLSFEPTLAEGDAPSVTVATKGINYAFLDVKGRASHAGVAPEDGRNAIIELAHQLLQLDDLGSPDLGTTLNWTIVTGGTKRNIIPEHAAAEGDMRYLDLGEYDRVLEEATGIVADKLIDDSEVSFRLEPGRPPLPPNAATQSLADRAVAIYDELGLELVEAEIGGGTDAAYAYDPESDTPVLESLGLAGGNYHNDEEYVVLDSIVPRLYLATRLIMEASAD